MDAQKQLERIGRYQILERVGKGGMGVLYRGFDPVLDREVAIKLMQADFTQDAEQMRPRFYREARAAAKLNHRNIVTIFEFAEESNVPYIVMEFLRGTSLGVRMGNQPPLTLDDKLSIVAQLCDGLAYAHEQGVVHRDVKPDNVFVLEDGTVKLLDFGIAKLTTSNITRQGDVLGSASYMSPEQVGGSEAVDGRADVFSTGVVLYELLTGHKPFAAEAPTAVVLKILRDDPAPLDTYVPGLPPALNAAVLKALAKEPAERFATADAFSRELQLIRRALPASQPTPGLEETRFADTMLLKSLRDDIERMRETPRPRSGGTPRPRTTATPRPSRDISGGVGQAAEAARESLSQDPTSPAQPSLQSSGFNAWMAAAFAGVVALVGAGAFIAFSASMNPPEPVSSSPAASSAVTSSAISPSAGASTPNAAAQPAVPGSGSAQPTPTSPTPGTQAPATQAAAADPRTTTPAAKPPAPRIPVQLSGAYAFEVQENGRVISAANTRHALSLPTGTTIVVSAPQYYLRQSLKIDGSPTQGMAYTAPELGSLDIRSTLETCDVIISDRKVGNPPLTIDEIAAGQHRVDIACGSEIAKTQFVPVRAGTSNKAYIR